jgi:DNA polymerase I-like protein with 3'-5' exonuclease and polymerase domains
MVMDAPNLQTVSRAVTLGGEFGPPPFESATRAAVRAPPGGRLVVADYRQMELRLAAHLSGDPALVAAFARGGGAADGDPLTAVAATVHAVPPAAVTPAQRYAAKRVAYGLMYGMGDARLADELDVTEAYAARVREQVAAALPGLAAWTDAAADAVRRRDGVAVTLGGRARAFDLGAGSRDHAGSVVSFIVQGSAADILKAVLLQLDALLAAGDGGAGLPPGVGRIVMQVHDEVLVEAATAVHAPAVAAAVTRVMEGQAGGWGLAVPLPVRAAVVGSWTEAA